MSKRVYELALPKGNITLDCEICGKKATTKCEDCKVTHYCCQEHKLVDAISFHKIVCKKLAYIRTEHPLPFSEIDRAYLKNEILKCKKEVLKLAETNTRKWLLERKPVNAYPSAMIGWNMACDIHSSDSREVIYCTCLVAEVFLNLKDLVAAEKYMVHASWISKRYDILPANILSELYRLRGLVLMATEKWSEARQSLAEYAYAIATTYGIDDLRMGIPYGLLGLSILHFDNVDGAMASFHKMADTWLGYLLSQYKEKLMRVATENEMSLDREVQELEFQYMEARIVFERAYETVRRLPMDAKTDMILCFQTMCRMREGNSKGAIVFKEEALATATRTRQDKAVLETFIPLLVEVLGDDYILRWDKKHRRPKTVATKYLEMIKAINV